MKKKIEALLNDGSVSDNAEYASLHKAYVSSKNTFEKTKKEKSEAKKTYRDALDNSETNQERLLELLTAFRQAKFMHLYHRAGLKLDKHRLHHWLEAWLKNSEVPHEPKKSKSAEPKAKKRIAEKSTAATTRQPKTTKTPTRKAG